MQQSFLRMKLKNFFSISLFILATLLSVVFAKKVIADTACGPSAYCTGNNAYLRVFTCAPSSNGENCYNDSYQNNYPHTCPVGGGSGSCVAWADGRLGCLDNDPVVDLDSCRCSQGGQSCTPGNSCGTSLPYTGSCQCAVSSCGSPQGGPLGCCLAGMYCGDGSCNNGETCSSCPSDCGTCSGATAVPTCGNGVCASGESCNTCPQDCGSCVACGDGACNGGETCNTCAQDCGQCPAVCGNHVVESGETCVNCPVDMGVCPPTTTPAVCPNGSCSAGETCNTCPQDCGACQPPPPPSCTCDAPYCGQLDTCGTAQCSDIDDWEAPAPTQTSPADGEIVEAIDSNNGVPTKAITLTITTQASPNYNAAETYIDVYPTGTSCAHVLADCGVLVSDTAGHDEEITYTYHIPVAQYGAFSSYRWRVWHKNDTCTLRDGEASPWQTFIVGDTITGSVLRDDGIAGFSGSVCTSPFTPVAYTPQGGEIITVTYNGTDYTTTLNPDGTFEILAPVSSSGENTVSFATSNPSDTCGCPAGCTYNGIDSPTNNLTFYYQPFDIRDPWWQTIGGHIFAGRETASAILSSIPVDTCIGTCEAYLSLRDANDEAESSGAILTGGGTIDTANTVGYQTDNIDEDNRDMQATGTSMDTLVENYDYFYRLYSMGLQPANDINSPSNKPTASPTNGRAHYRNGNLIINNAWSLGATESLVIFVNGDLTINNTITVPEGAFLAFITSGNITFGNTVCQNDPDSVAAVVQGVFIADGSISVNNQVTGDCKFVGEGIFAAWNGFNLRRDYRDGGSGDFISAQHPVELFKYRPDFVVNIPERMTRPLYQWQEVAP